MTTKKRYDKEEVVTVNTDASWDPNLLTGGFGIWIKSDFFTIKKSGQFRGKVLDSNEAEIKALINALHLLQKNKRKFKGVVINCDNAVVRDIVNKKVVPERFKEEGKRLISLVAEYKFAKAKNIRGHQNSHNARQWVNNWCDKASKEYRSKVNFKEIKRLEKEASDLEFMAEGLIYEHQEVTKFDLLNKAKTLRDLANDLKQTEEKN